MWFSDHFPNNDQLIVDTESILRMCALCVKMERHHEFHPFIVAYLRRLSQRFYWAHDRSSFVGYLHCPKLDVLPPLRELLKHPAVKFKNVAHMRWEMQYENMTILEVWDDATLVKQLTWGIKKRKMEL